MNNVEFVHPNHPLQNHMLRDAVAQMLIIERQIRWTHNPGR
jgi:hypothetical protein